MSTSFSRPTRRCVLTLAAAALALSASAGALAQDYPTRPIRLVVPYTPGTGYDSIARLVSPALSQRLGQPVVIENLPGASSTIGAGQVARAPADGYTLLMIGEGTMASAHLYKNLPFDPLADFAPITLAAHGTLMLMTNPKSGIHSVQDLVDRARKQPGALTYSSPGIGTSQALKMAMIEDAAGIHMLHVPYKGSAGALNDLVAGQVTAGLIPIHQGMPFLASGKLVPLAVISPERNPKAPEVPTLRESGISGVDANMWYAFVAPKGTKAAVVSRLNKELRQVIATPEVKSGMERIGLEVVTSTPEELGSVMANESRQAADIIQKAHIVLQ